MLSRSSCSFCLCCHAPSPSGPPPFRPLSTFASASFSCLLHPVCHLMPPSPPVSHHGVCCVERGVERRKRQSAKGAARGSEFSQRDRPRRAARCSACRSLISLGRASSNKPGSQLTALCSHYVLPASSLFNSTSFARDGIAPRPLSASGGVPALELPARRARPVLFPDQRITQSNSNLNSNSEWYSCWTAPGPAVCYPAGCRDQRGGKGGSEHSRESVPSCRSRLWTHLQP